MHLTPICSQGIQWTPVEFFDNSIICNLIENVSCPPVPGARFGVPAPPHHTWCELGLRRAQSSPGSMEPLLGAGAGLG